MQRKGMGRGGRRRKENGSIGGKGLALIEIMISRRL